MAHVQPWIVVEHGADAGQHGAGAPAPGVAVGARLGAGDPLAGAVEQCGATVQRRRDLHPHPGALALHAREEADVDVARGVGDVGVGHLDLDAGRAQARDAFARYLREGVAHRDDDTAKTGFDEGVAARRCAAVVGAGL